MTTNFSYFCSIILISIAIVSCKKFSSVYQTVPRTNEQLHVLRVLNNRLKGVSYWRDPSHVNETIDLLVPDEHNEEFKTIMNENSLAYKLQIPDLQELLNNSIDSVPKNQIRSIRTYNGKSSSLDWTRFNTLDEINSWLDTLVSRYPGTVSIIIGGQSSENRKIRGVRIRFGNKNLPGVFIEAGIHAREWLSHATATYLINELLTSRQPEVRSIAESYEWYIFPCVNPDGYVYTHINPRDEKYRLWRKTRVKHSTIDCSYYRCTQKDCYGSDLNRNWDFKWGGSGSDKNNACSDIYAGKSAFSEIETRSLSQYMKSLKNIFAYISFHTYIHSLLFPYGHTKDHLDNYNEQYSVGSEAIRALSKKYGTQYKIGNIAEMVGVTSGSSVDWAKTALNVPFAYCYEMRGQTSKGQYYGFVAPPSEIIPNAEEVVDSLVVLLRAAAKSRGYKLKP